MAATPNANPQPLRFRMTADVAVTVVPGQPIVVDSHLHGATFFAKLKKAAEAHRGAAAISGVQQRRQRNAARQGTPGSAHRRATIPAQAHVATPTSANMFVVVETTEGSSLRVYKAFRDYLVARVQYSAFELLATRMKAAYNLAIRTRLQHLRATVLSQQERAAAYAFELKKDAMEMARRGRSLALGSVVTLETRSLLGDFTFVVDARLAHNIINLHYLDSLRPHHIRPFAMEGSTEDNFVKVAVLIREWCGFEKTIAARPVIFKIHQLGVSGPKFVVGKPWIAQN